MSQPNSTLIETSIPRVAVAQLGSRWNYDMPIILEKLGMLTCFYTDAYCGEGSWLAPLRWLPSFMTSASVRRLQSRTRCELPADKVKAFNLLGIEYALRCRQISNHEDYHRLFLEINQRFNQLVCTQGFFLDTNVVFGMNTASLEIFESLQGTQIKRLMDQNQLPMQIMSEIMAEEYNRWPDWVTGIWTDWQGAAIFRQLIEREKREWSLANLILCASSHTAAALISCGVPEHKCKVVPYPVNVQTFSLNRSPIHSRPLRLLFVGHVDLRKGIPYFLEMLRRLRSRGFEARVVGPIQVKPKILERYGDLCTFTGAVPRLQMPTHYAWADIFVLPSLCESAPGAIIEALAAGLPVITTPGAGTLVEDGVEGWVVPNRSIEALVTRVEQLDANRKLLEQLSYNAALKSRKMDVYTYGKQLQQVCEYLLSNECNFSK